MTLVVRRRRPVLAIMVGIASIAVLGTVIWWFVDSERLRAASDGEMLRGERDGLLRERESLVEENQTLARKVAILERNRQVESEAYQRVDRELATLQQEILELREELTFYRGIVADNSTAGNVRIQRFALEQEGAPRDYRFRLVLTRGIRSDKVASGAVSLAVDGDRDGKGLRLELHDLSPFPVGPLQFSFKHFQRIEGRLRLPDRFVPRSVVVRVSADREGARPLRETFKWPSIKS